MSELLYDTLEACLKELENGADIEAVLARHPQIADELRPILHASVAARSMAGAEPSPDALRRGRARLLQRAAEMREAEAALNKRKIPLFPRLAISFALVVIFFMISGTSLLNASAGALPGERLYTVKRSAENIRLLLTIDPSARTALETQFYYERLSEVTALLAQGQVAPVEFAGIYLQVDGQVFVSGIQIVILDSTILPPQGIQDGNAVLVFGATTPNGTVQANTIHLLGNPSVAPPGDSTPTPAPTMQIKPSSTPLPTHTVMPTPTLLPTIIIPQPTQIQPPTNAGNGNSNQNSGNNNDNDDNKNDNGDDDGDDDDDDDDDD